MLLKIRHCCLCCVTKKGAEVQSSGVESKTDNSMIAGAEGRGQVDGAEEPEDRQIVENTHKKPPDENVQRAGPSLHFPEQAEA